MTEPIKQPGGNLPDPEQWQSDEDNAECVAFQASMAQRIGDGEDLQSHPHMATCPRCPALVRDLEAIAIVARQLMPPDAEPDEDLWTKIEKKLALESLDGAGGESGRPGAESPSSGLSLESGLALEGGIA
jgi:hypothetical protein